MNQSSIRSNRGFTLIEILVASTIGFIVLYAIATAIQNQSNQMNRLDAKSYVIQTQNAIAAALADSGVCSPQLSDNNLPPLDYSSVTTTSPSSMKLPMNKILMGTGSDAEVGAQANQKLPGLNNGPLIDQIYVTDFTRRTATDDTNYSANLYVSFKQTANANYPIRPIKVKMNLTTDSAALSSRRITNCHTIMPGMIAASAAPAQLPPGTIAGVCTYDVRRGKATNVRAPAIAKSSGHGAFLRAGCDCEPGWTAFVMDNNIAESHIGAVGTNTVSCIKD